MNKDYRQLIKELRKAGYIVDETRRHPAVSHPEKQGRVTLVTTASDYRSWQNSLADLRRVFGFVRKADQHKRKKKGS